MKEEFDIEDLYKDEFGQDQLTPPQGGFSGASSKHLLKSLKIYGGIGLLSLGAIVGVYQMTNTSSSLVEEENKIVQESKSKNHVLGAVQSQSDNSSEGAVVAAFPERSKQEELSDNHIDVQEHDNVSGAEINEDIPNELTDRKPSSITNSDPENTGSESVATDRKKTKQVNSDRTRSEEIAENNQATKTQKAVTSKAKQAAQKANDPIDLQQAEMAREKVMANAKLSTGLQVESAEDSKSVVNEGGKVASDQNEVSETKQVVSTKESVEETVAEGIEEVTSKKENFSTTNENNVIADQNTSKEKEGGITAKVDPKKAKGKEGEIAAEKEGENEDEDVLALADDQKLEEEAEELDEKEADEKIAEVEEKLEEPAAQPEKINDNNEQGGKKFERNFKINIFGAYGRSLLAKTDLRSPYSSIDEFGFALKKRVNDSRFDLSVGLSYTTQRHVLTSINNDFFIPVDEDDPVLFYNDHVEYFSLVKRHIELPISVNYFLRHGNNWQLDAGAGLKYSRVIDAFEDIDYSPSFIEAFEDDIEELSDLEEEEHVVGEARLNFLSANLFIEAQRMFSGFSLFTRLKYRMPIAEMYDSEAGLAWDYDFSSNALMLGVGVEF